MVFFWICTLIGSIFGALSLIGAVFMSNGAPQQAAGAAIAVALAVIPYVFTRSLDCISAAEWRKKMLEAANRPPPYAMPPAVPIVGVMRDRPS